MLAASMWIGLAGTVAAEAKPLKVYILAGQSNMEGHARIETFDYIGEDPATAPLLKAMRGPDGQPRVCDKVWISYFTGGQTSGEGFGRLTAGYGARSDPARDGGKIGPEFTFGIAMEEAYDGPVLIIKTAWGGKSLHTDFRPPSAGPYEMNASQQRRYRERGVDIEKWKADKAEATGKYYRLMVDHVRKVLADPQRVCPVYDAQAGHDIAGFVWFQGWNDMCDGDTYPDNHKPGAYALYTELMAHFIRDVRRDLKAPDMPFVIGVIGVDGDRARGGIAHLRPAMAAPAQMPEFQGNVAAVETAPYWDHAMAALQSKKALADHRLNVAHMITEAGVMEEPEAGVPGWEPIGTPKPRDRIWRFLSFDPHREADRLPRKEKKRFRDVTLPAELTDWYKPGFDDSHWNRGKAPIGKGIWKHRLIGKGVVQYKTEWGEGEFILMRTVFEVDELDYEAFRLSVLARQGFHVYLNGHKIHTYIWWKDEPQYRPILLEPDHRKHLKRGKNVVAIYANAEYDRRTEACFAATDLMIEGISQPGLAYVNSAAYRDQQMHKVCTPAEAKIIRGCSNGGYHYLGSAKIMAQIGQAFAQAMLEMEQR
jgi:alpha-galactosidase